MQGHRVHMLELGDDALAARTRQHVHDLAAAHQRCLVIPLQLHAGAEGQWTERAAPCMLNNRLQQQRLCTSAAALLKCRAAAEVQTAKSGTVCIKFGLGIP